MTRILDQPRNQIPFYVATMRSCIAGIRDQLDMKHPNREVINALFMSLEGALDHLIDAMPTDRRVDGR